MFCCDKKYIVYTRRREHAQEFGKKGSKILIRRDIMWEAGVINQIARSNFLAVSEKKLEKSSDGK